MTIHTGDKICLQTLLQAPLYNIYITVAFEFLIIYIYTYIIKALLMSSATIIVSCCFLLKHVAILLSMLRNAELVHFITMLRSHMWNIVCDVWNHDHLWCVGKCGSETGL